VDEARLSLRQAEKEFQISRATLRAWLLDAGMVFPPVARGSKLLVLRSDVLRVLSRRAVH
jgi:predicted site-specific integrase-resolvase